MLPLVLPLALQPWGWGLARLQWPLTWQQNLA
jgi:hypothetical protein